MNRTPLYKRTRSHIAKGLYRDGPMLSTRVVGEPVDEREASRIGAFKPDGTLYLCAGIEAPEEPLACYRCGYLKCSCVREVEAPSPVNEIGQAMQAESERIGPRHVGRKANYVYEEEKRYGPCTIIEVNADRGVLLRRDQWDLWCKIDETELLPDEPA